MPSFALLPHQFEGIFPTDSDSSSVLDYGEEAAFYPPLDCPSVDAEKGRYFFDSHVIKTKAHRSTLPLSAARLETCLVDTILRRLLCANRTVQNPCDCCYLSWGIY